VDSCFLDVGIMCGPNLFALFHYYIKTQTCMLKTVHFDFENFILCYRCTSFWYNILHVNVTLKAMQFELNRELKQYVYNDNN